MAKRKMENKAREKSKLMEERINLVEACLDSEISTKAEICKVTGLKRIELNTIFRENKKLYARFCVIRKLLVEKSTDNITAVVDDRTHPKNYEASKWILANYKSDLDADLDAKDSEEIEIDVNDDRKGRRPVVIRFGHKKSDEE